MSIRSVFKSCSMSIGCLIGLFAASAHAGVVIGNTRIIYPAQESQVTVQLTNDDTHSPLLVQAWIDDGNAKSTPDQLNVPFLLTPPIFRMEPGKGQALRIAHLKDKPLSSDKESVFWLNVLEVPPKPKLENSEAHGIMQLAFRTRIKFFFRPKDLKGTATDAPGQLRWKLVSGGGRQMLQAENPTAYYVSFEKVSLVAGGKDINSDDPQMIAPGGTQRFVLSEARLQVGANVEVHFTNIDDYGQIISHTAPVTP